ncbi:MAG: hypothetical protein F4Y92_03795 [Dehalococcoidia bacterium]|nr:hypothetical protein [Dehalococcoidia bacterium]
MIELEPDIDLYGTYARASAIADYIELLALHGEQPSRATVADYIDDASWGPRIHETFHTPEDAGAEEDDDGHGLGSTSEDAAKRVYSLLAARHDYLGDDYPFRLDAGGVRTRSTDPEPSPYLALLAITVSHAFKVTSSPNPRDIFQDTVAQALSSAGHRSLNFSRFREGHGSFEEALTAAGSALTLKPAPSAASASAYAQDAGGDVIAQISAGYLPSGGIGAWTLVGQVTCGKSDTWRKKLGEVEVPAWKARLGTVVPPLAFLAVPHHAERDHLWDLVASNERMVLDRLRLTHMLDSVSADEGAILQAVLDTPVASLVPGT